MRKYRSEAPYPDQGSWGGGVCTPWTVGRRLPSGGEEKGCLSEVVKNMSKPEH